MKRTIGALGLTALAACAGSAPRSHAPRWTERGVRFTLEAPGAKEVRLAGSFDNWSLRGRRMTSADGRIWEATVPLPPGRHAYVFLLDGRPVRPPHAALYEADAFGGENGVLVLR